jgi:CRP-like cAMP-binding protein
VPAFVLVLAPKLNAIDRAAASRAASLAPRLQILTSLQILAAAPQAVLERLAAAATESTVPAGETIIREGDAADALYVLVDGEVEVTAHGEGGTERHIRVMTAPTYFGEIGLIQHVPRTATNTALTECRVLRIDGETFLAALAGSSPSQILLQGMAGRLAATAPITPPTGPPRDETAPPAAFDVSG